MSNWWDYQPELYVDRDDIQQALNDWLVDPMPKRLIRSLIGPPGVGKSWLLKHLFDTEKEGRLVFELNVPDLVSANHDDLKRELVKQANSCCTDLHYLLDPALAFSALIEDLGACLCDRCPTPAPLILVDGCDGISPSEFDRAVQQLLRPFFGPPVDCFRMIVARRSKLADYHLKKMDQPICVWSLDSKSIGAATEQVGKFVEHFHPGHTKLLDFRNLLPSSCSYSWNHPFINAFLLDRAASHGSLTSTHLKDCCIALLNHSANNMPTRYLPSSEAECEELVKLATNLPDRWEIQQYTQQPGLTSDDVARYQDRGIIVNLELLTGEPNKEYCIADGLRELLRDLASMWHKERES
jgi:hypothetical protein